MKKKTNYGLTDLDPLSTFEHHVFHRDQFAHFLRWSHILKIIKPEDTIVDFGCGKGYLAEVLYRNRKKCKKYIGIDIRKQTIDNNNKRLNLAWVEFIQNDLVKPTITFEFGANRVCSFEVIEHVGKNNVDTFLKNFLSCGKDDAIYYLSTPNYDQRVGAAENHTYDSGNGVEIQEFGYKELEIHLLKYFDIVNKYGTFASQRDYKHLLTEYELSLWNKLSDYYDVNLMSNIFAPLYPQQSRNCLWVLKKKN